MKVAVVLALFMLSTAAIAQPMPPQQMSMPANSEDQVATTLGQLFIANIRMNAQLQQMQSQIRDLTLAKAEAERKLAEAMKGETK